MLELTDEEVTAINASRGKCPDCLQGNLIEGPHGGAAINFECNNKPACGHRFNLFLDLWRCFGGHRLS